jgi:hypothetical protein
MATVKSVFGQYADSANLQYMIDSSLDRFAPTWFQNYFDWGVPQSTLTYITVIGRSRVEAAASVIARGSAAPLRARPGIDKLTGEIPPIAEKMHLLENTYREYKTLQALPGVSDGVKKNAILDLIFNDVKRVGNAAMKRLDYFCLEAISTGQITLTTINNPDGVVIATLDLLMPAGNKSNAAITWATAATATPIDDIQTIVNNGISSGRSFAKILMSLPTWQKFIKTTQVKDLFGAYAGKVNNKVIPTLDGVNQFLTGLRLPPIEIVDVAIGIEKDGIISTLRPFKDEAVVFIPDGKLGTIHNALSIEQMEPIKNVSYATYNNALISKWGDNEPWQEFTKSELNAMPGLDAIDGIFIMTAVF